MTTPARPVDVAAGVLGDRARRDVPLGPLTTYRVGGPAALFLLAESDDDLVLAAAAVQRSQVPTLVVGNGSNLLVADAGFAGLAIQLGDAFAAVDLEVEPAVVRAGGAALLPVVARRSAAAGLTGFEWAVGVPGSIGGAVCMNAGGHGSDMAATLVSVRAIDLATGHDEEMPAAALDLGYRRSSLRAAHVVTAATLQLSPGDRARAEAAISEIVRWRRENQPGGQNAGSVFTNPPGDSAGRLIDAAGCKGRRVGTAEVSAKHANFFIAADGGSADDVVALMVEVQQRVETATGVRLHPETRLVGFNPQVLIEGS